jgi:hypothetical protein
MRKTSRIRRNRTGSGSGHGEAAERWRAGGDREFGATQVLNALGGTAEQQRDRERAATATHSVTP